MCGCCLGLLGSRDTFASETFEMGIDAGILVTRQITDEGAWVEAMLEINRVFSGEEYFRREPPTAGLFTNMKADLWEVQEPVNFTGVHSQRPFDDWETYHKIADYDFVETGLPGVEISSDRVDIDTLAELRERVRVLEEACERIVLQIDGEVHVRDRDLQKELGRAKIALSTASAVIEASATDPYELEASAFAVAGVKNCSRFGDGFTLYAPRLFTFEAGSHTSLPVFARHFRAFHSKISGNTYTLNPQP